MEVWEGKEKNKQELKDPTFDFKKGDDVRLLIRKGAFEKGTWEYTKDVFRIYDVQRPDKKSTSCVAKYFVMDSDGNPLTSMDSETGKEEPSYYMGYQLLLANDIEDSPNYNEKNAASSLSHLASRPCRWLCRPRRWKQRGGRPVADRRPSGPCFRAVLPFKAAPLPTDTAQRLRQCHRQEEKDSGLERILLGHGR